ncbi:MAG: YbhB/YbcL family Raf kinase inhibitor-like protein [Parcubacteria group bacterium]|nr:YbhB/YbcL family Raf kinase inhibitor-like protein [Parcubacteria group bacterium]
MSLTLTSSAFTNGGIIPSAFTCDGDNANPPLMIDGVPEGTKSLALLMDDPDVPKQLRPDGVFDHWVLFNIDPTTKSIATGEFAGVQGANSAGKSAYTGPCPPPQYEPSEHRYFFKLYALNTMLDLKEGATKQEVATAIDEGRHIIDETVLIGKYKRMQ